MKKRKLILLCTAALLSAGQLLFAEPPPEKDGRSMPPPPAGKHPNPAHGGKHFRKDRPPLPPDMAPDEKARLEKLAKDDPQAFRTELRAYFEKQRTKEVQEILALRAKVLKASTPEEAQKAQEELRTKIASKFDQHLSFAEKRIAEDEANLQNMQKRLEKFKAETERRKAGRDAIIEKTMKEFLDPQKEPQFPSAPPPMRKK